VLALPAPVVATLAAFAPLFSRRVFRQVQVLIIGAILAPGKRTVTSALRAMGLHQEPQFQKYHRVLSRNRWSSRKAAHVLLGLLVRTFASTGSVIIGMDETLERRQGEKIAAKGIYRDAARSSRSVFVKTHGLRWISMMLLAPIPWAGRVWALPFLSVLAPSERYDQEHHRPAQDPGAVGRPDDRSGEVLAAQSSCGAGGRWWLLGVDAAGSLCSVAIPNHHGHAPAPGRGAL